MWLRYSQSSSWQESPEHTLPIDVAAWRALSGRPIAVSPLVYRLCKHAITRSCAVTRHALTQAVITFQLHDGMRVDLYISAVSAWTLCSGVTGDLDGALQRLKLLHVTATMYIVTPSLTRFCSLLVRPTHVDNTGWRAGAVNRDLWTCVVATLTDMTFTMDHSTKQHLNQTTVTC
jgi:hypothetical protein